MPSTFLAELLKLPANERAELALALWASLTDEERDAELVLSSEHVAELERRWAEHAANRGSTIPGDEVRRRLKGGE